MKCKASRLLVLAAVASLATVKVRAAEPIPDEYKINGWAMGCQAWSFNKFTAFEAIDGGPTRELWLRHFAQTTRKRLAILRPPAALKSNRLYAAIQ